MRLNPLSFVRYTWPVIQLMYKHGIPSYILYFGDSLGDNLLLTTLAKELYDRGHKNIWIKCNHQDLFTNNPYIKLVVPFHTVFSSLLLKALGITMRHPMYTVTEPGTDRDRIPEKHIILKMADGVGLTGTIDNKPLFFLDKAEEKQGRYADRQLVIFTSSVAARVPMRNKEWVTERYQQLVDELSEDYTIIQLGSENDTPLTHVIDLRGKTSLRESAAILKNSALMVSHVGFMMHLARAVDCPSVIIYGGREKPEQSGYNCFHNLYSPVPCSPCWLHNTCAFNKQCMTLISVADVKAAVLSQLQRASAPLPVDVLKNA